MSDGDTVFEVVVRHKGSIKIRGVKVADIDG